MTPVLGADFTPPEAPAESDLPILHETCVTCDGAGMVENAEEFGRFWEEHGKDCDPLRFRTCEQCRHAPREEDPCPECEGRKSTLTEDGRGLIDFLLRFGFVRRSI